VSAVPRAITVGRDFDAAYATVFRRRSSPALLEESQVESCEHQDNANIHHQSFPESVSEEHEIYADYNRCHRHYVKHDSYLSAQYPWLAIPVLIGRQRDEPGRESTLQHGGDSACHLWRFSDVGRCST
jgi:hypothetical protein